MSAGGNAGGGEYDLRGDLVGRISDVIKPYIPLAVGIASGALIAKENYLLGGALMVASVIGQSYVSGLERKLGE